MSAALFGLLGKIRKAYPLEKVTQEITVSGVWARPADMVGDVVWITGCGGGGGGGGANATSSSYHAVAGGGSGACSVFMVPYALLGDAAVSCEVGAGGTGGSPGLSGANGGDIVFGRLRIPGGNGGDGASATSSGYDYSSYYANSPLNTHNISSYSSSPLDLILTQTPLIDGGYGGRYSVGGSKPFASKFTAGTAVYGVGGGGGASMFGSGGNGSRDADGSPGTGYGSGGGGAAAYSGPGSFYGGDGAPGRLLITYLRRVIS